MKSNPIVVNVLRFLRILLKVIPFVISLLDKSSDRIAKYVDDAVHPDETEC